MHEVHGEIEAFVQIESHLRTSSRMSRIVETTSYHSCMTNCYLAWISSFCEHRIYRWRHPDQKFPWLNHLVRRRPHGMASLEAMLSRVVCYNWAWCDMWRCFESEWIRFCEISWDSAQHFSRNKEEHLVYRRGHFLACVWSLEQIICSSTFRNSRFRKR